MTRIKHSNDNLASKVRTFYMMAFFMGILIVAFCLRWQVVEAQKFIEYAKSRSITSELKSYRGAIYSKDGTTLAYSEPRFNIYVWMDDLILAETNGTQTRQEFYNKMSAAIGQKPSDVQTVIENYYSQKIRWIPIAKDLTNTEYDKINALYRDTDPSRKLTGWDYEVTSKRIYPEGRLASQLVGLTNEVNGKLTGVGGIEEHYDGLLNPRQGFLTGEKDAIGQTVTMALQQTIEPKNGSSVYTTIDKNLQKVIEQKLKEGVEQYKSISGSVVIEDPKTGSIMAMANYPDYDPNIRAEKDPQAYGNSATLRPYEAGSIGKIMTLSTAVDMGIVNKDTVVLPNGHQGCETIHPDLPPLCTWDKLPVNGPMKAFECFYKSDNICFFHLAEMINRKDMYSYFAKFGVGSASGIDLGRTDSYGLWKDYTDWNIGDVAAFSFGHGYQVNLVQAADYVSTIANFGVRMKPRVVDKVVDSDGNVKDYKPIVVERAVTKETSDKMVEMMNINFDFSTPEWYNKELFNDYYLGVKSGTALLVENGVYVDDINASFVGFDASPERTFVMTLWLEKPENQLSFYNSRPLWLDMFAAVKDIIGVPRKGTF
ncbi:MAG: peptidoglycan D,D-transpeptidase FtsI family protein [Candidatus Dojkabacteria bacterium]